MNCDEAEELLGAYAFDALPDAEARDLRRHLATCPEHAAKAAELLPTARLTYALADPVAAPAALRSRVLDAIAREPRGAPSRAADHAAGHASRAARRPSDRLAWTRRYAPVGWAAAAALLVAAIGLVAWNGVLLSGGSDTDAERFARTATVQYMRPTDGGNDATMVRFAGEDKAVVLFNRKPLDASKTYQLWRISDNGRPVSIGLTRGDSGGHVAAVVPYDPNSASVIAVTIEPAGGSDQPTSSPIFQSG